MAPSNCTAELCQNRNNTVPAPGFVRPNPITRPCDTDTDSDPDPELASPLNFSEDHRLEPHESRERGQRPLPPPLYDLDCPTQ
ncbi:MAG: hypothetical protein ACOX52_10360 [Verrucomicrobiota bacterium]